MGPRLVEPMRYPEHLAPPSVIGHISKCAAREFVVYFQGEVAVNIFQLRRSHIALIAVLIFVGLIVLGRYAFLASR